MPRVPSIRLRAARLNNKILERFERKIEDDPSYVPDVKESQTLVNLAKVDSLLRDRATSREEEEDSEQTEEQKQQKAKELVRQLTRPDGPAAMVSRSEGDDDSEP